MITAQCQREYDSFRHTDPNSVEAFNKLSGGTGTVSLFELWEMADALYDVPKMV